MSILLYLAFAFLGYITTLLRLQVLYSLRRGILTCEDKLRGFSPPANYTDRATAACRRSYANFSG
jgi:hypothetical protein